LPLSRTTQKRTVVAQQHQLVGMRISKPPNLDASIKRHNILTIGWSG
jgi:hypothetical protein